MLLDLTACERSAFGSDYNKCRVIFKTDGHELFTQEFSREENIAFHHQLDLDWSFQESIDLTFTLEAADAGQDATPIPCDQDRFGGRSRALGAKILGPARQLFSLFSRRCS